MATLSESIIKDGEAWKAWVKGDLEAIAKARKEHGDEVDQLRRRYEEEKAELHKKYMAAHEHLLATQRKRFADVTHPLVVKSRMRNAAQLISVIPVEMLGEIFQQLMLSFLQSDPITYGWITVTQVCFHWRSVAFAKPSLWRYIHIHTRRAGFILERALKTRTLIEFYSTNGDWIKEGEKRLAESLFRDHPQRIRLIHMTRTKAERPYFRVSDKNPPAHPPLDTLFASSKLTGLVDVRLDSSYEPWYSLDVWLTWISHLPSLKYLELEKGVCSEASLLGQDFTFPGTLEVLKFRFHRIPSRIIDEVGPQPTYTFVAALQRCSVETEKPHTHSRLQMGTTP